MQQQYTYVIFMYKYIYIECVLKRACVLCIYFTAAPPSASNSKQPSSQQHQHHQHRTRRTQRRVTHNEKRYHSGIYTDPWTFLSLPRVASTLYVIWNTREISLFVPGRPPSLRLMSRVRRHSAGNILLCQSAIAYV